MLNLFDFNIDKCVLFKILNISEQAESYGHGYSEALLGLHVFTGEDVTSAFKGKGKVLPLRKLQSNPKFHDTFRY